MKNYKNILLKDLKGNEINDINKLFEEGENSLQVDYNNIKQKNKKILNKRKFESYNRYYLKFYKAYFIKFLEGDKIAMKYCDLCSIIISEIQTIYLTPIYYKITFLLSMFSLALGIGGVFYSIYINKSSSDFQDKHDSSTHQIIENQETQIYQDSCYQTKIQELEIELFELNKKITSVNSIEN